MGKLTKQEILQELKTIGILEYYENEQTKLSVNFMKLFSHNYCKQKSIFQAVTLSIFEFKNDIIEESEIIMYSDILLELLKLVPHFKNTIEKENEILSKGYSDEELDRIFEELFEETIKKLP